jgi:hypothetical protein
VIAISGRQLPLSGPAVIFSSFNLPPQDGAATFLKPNGGPRECFAFSGRIID